MAAAAAAAVIPAAVEAELLVRYLGGGGGGGSFINPTFAQPFVISQNNEALTSSPSDGSIQYQFAATLPIATRDLYFECHKGTEVQEKPVTGPCSGSTTSGALHTGFPTAPGLPTPPAPTFSFRATATW